MNQWYVYPSTSPKTYADIQTELTFTGSLLSKKVVADMTKGYQYLGTIGEKFFSSILRTRLSEGLDVDRTPATSNIVE